MYNSGEGIAPVVGLGRVVERLPTSAMLFIFICVRRLCAAIGGGD
jgi:hypothetical protein